MKVVFEQVYTGLDAVEHFLTTLVNLQPKLIQLCQKYEKMQITKVEETSFHLANTCHICKKKIEKTDVKVRDHDHTTGR